MIVCPNCNHSNPESAVQCEACYQSLPVLVACPKCSQPNMSTAAFCGSCGYSLQPDLTMAQPEAMLLPKTTPTPSLPVLPTRLQAQQNPILLHLQTQQEIEIISEDSIVYIGKPNEKNPPDIDVTGFPDADIVSRVHAAIHIDGNKYYVEDLGSSNGTYLNQNQLVTKTRHLLKSGDRISLGKGDRVTFIFQVFLF